VNGGSLTDLANRLDYSALYTGTRGKLASNIGFTLGLGLGVAAVAIGMPQVQTLYAPLALVAVFILAALFLLPFDMEADTAGYKTLVLTNMHESPDVQAKQAREAIAKQFKLSPRETDVLGGLMKGRNAKYISEKLYISESTVKTHISNVYRKVGVHSQQELLDTIEKLR